jgi:hypothetical protein
VLIVGMNGFIRTNKWTNNRNQTNQTDKNGSGNRERIAPEFIPSNFTGGYWFLSDHSAMLYQND